MHMYIAAPVYKRASNILDWNLRDDFCFSLKAIKMNEKFSKMLQLHKKVWGDIYTALQPLSSYIFIYENSEAVSELCG